MRTRAAALLLLAASPVLAAGTPPPDAALKQIDAAGLRAKMRMLSDDLMEGRASDERGYALASAWVASQLEALGLEPAGENGTFFQRVPITHTTARDVTFRVGGRPIGAAHALAMAGTSAPTLDVDAEVVFAGYGISAPHLGRDDYRNLDVRGKVVAILGGAPQSFPGDERAHHGSPRQKEIVAASKGAVGIVAVTDTLPDSGYWRAVSAFARRGELRVPEPAGAPATTLPFIAMFDREATTQLLAGSGRTYEQLAQQARPGLRLMGRLQAHGTVTQETLVTRNVVARLPGRTLPAESVVFSAHLDHLGIAPEGEDRIYNGAIDNGSGVAAILEIAEAFTAAGEHPARSIVFLACAAEEMGLLGSGYFASHPTVDARGIAANVNVDMLPLQPALQPVREVVAFGAEHSSLDDVVARAAKTAGLHVVPDPMPEERIFVRSDQYSFVKQGVPAVMLAGGGPNWVKGLHDWLSATYHSVDDELAPDMDLTGGLTVTEVSFRIAWDVATDPARPRWKPESFFGKTFAR